MFPQPSPSGTGSERSRFSLLPLKKRDDVCAHRGPV
jgi:hypothetical protein